MPTKTTLTHATTKAVRKLADATGVGEIARALVGAEQAVIDRLVDKARELNISKAKISAALRAKRKHDQALSVVALLIPSLPNPALLKLIAGKSEAKKAPR